MRGGGNLFLKVEWDQRSWDKRPLPFPDLFSPPPLQPGPRAGVSGTFRDSQRTRSPSENLAKVWVSMKGCVFLGEVSQVLQGAPLKARNTV